MLSILDKAFERIHGKKNDTKRSAWSDYREKIVLPLAKDKEIDLELLEQFMEALELSEQQVRADVETLKRRFAIVDQLANLQTKKAEVAKLTVEQQKLIAEREKWWSEFSTRADPIDAQLRLLQNQNIEETIARLTSDMQQSVMDPVHKARVKEINEALSALGKEVYEIEQKGYLDREKEHRDAIEAAKRLRQSYKARQDYDAADKANQQDEIISHHERMVAQLVSIGYGKRMQEIAKERAALEHERSGLLAKSMLP